MIGWDTTPRLCDHKKPADTCAWCAWLELSPMLNDGLVMTDLAIDLANEVKP